MWIIDWILKCLAYALADSLKSSAVLAAAIWFSLFPLLGRSIARGKGRSGSEGFALGLILGPVGCMIEVSLPAQTSVTPGRYASLASLYAKRPLDLSKIPATTAMDDMED